MKQRKRRKSDPRIEDGGWCLEGGVYLGLEGTLIQLETRGQGQGLVNKGLIGVCGDFGPRSSLCHQQTSKGVSVLEIDLVRCILLRLTSELIHKEAISEEHQYTYQYFAYPKASLIQLQSTPENKSNVYKQEHFKILCLRQVLVLCKRKKENYLTESGVATLRHI